MSRQDPSAADALRELYLTPTPGVADPYHLARCRCTHLVTYHVLAAPGRRTKCSASTCTCRTFTPEET